MSMNFNRLSTDDKILIMEGAQVLGDVVAGEGTAFWYNSVCRGEMQSVRIGKRCNIQDLALIHNKVTIGDDVSVGTAPSSTARRSEIASSSAWAQRSSTAL